MKKKKVEEITSPSAVKSISTSHKKFGETVSVNGCFGSSDLGQMTGALSIEIRNRIPNAFMRCPYALFPEVEGPGQTLMHDDYQVVIDGCKERCLKKTLEKAGIKVDLSYALDDDFGLEKHPQPKPFNKEEMLKVASKIEQDIHKMVPHFEVEQIMQDANN